MRIVVTHDDQLNDDGTLAEVDITEGVQALYDLATNSLDYHSGFWTVDDAVPVALLARSCGFKQADELEAYVEEHRRQEAEDKRRREEQLIRHGLANERMKDPAWIFKEDPSDE